MFSDILKAVEMILGLLQGSDRSDRRKRRRLAKWLLQLYTEIEEILDAGERLLAMLAEGGTDVEQPYHARGYTVRRWDESMISLLRRMQMSIERLSARLADSEMKTILGIMDPKLRPITLVHTLDGKRDVLGILLSQFTENDESRLFNQVMEHYCDNCKSGFEGYLSETYSHGHWRFGYGWSRRDNSPLTTEAERIEVLGLQQYIEQYRDAVHAVAEARDHLGTLLKAEFTTDELI